MGSTESDSSLWLKATSGTNRAFVVLFDRYQPRVFRAAYRHVGDVADAEDVVAIVFLEVWRLRKKVRIVDDSLAPWLLTLTMNVSLNFRRAQRRYRMMLSKFPPSLSTEDPAQFSDERIDFEERASELRSALSRLSAADRVVVELCLVEELSIRAAAATLDIPEGTVKSRLHRARRQLRSNLFSAGSGTAVDTKPEHFGGMTHEPA